MPSDRFDYPNPRPAVVPNWASSPLACRPYFRVVSAAAPHCTHVNWKWRKCTGITPMSLLVDTYAMGVALWCHPEVSAPIPKWSCGKNSAKILTWAMFMTPPAPIQVLNWPNPTPDFDSGLGLCPSLMDNNTCDISSKNFHGGYQVLF